MDTQVMNMNDRSGVSGVSPQARSASAPVYTPSTPQGYPLGRPYPDSPRESRSAPQPRYSPVPQAQAPQPRPEPVFSGKPVRTVDERHDAFTRAQEALHDRHYEDNNLRLQAEIALAEFFLA